MGVGRGNLSSRSFLRPFKGRRDLFWVGGSLRFLGGPSSFGTISLSFTNVATGGGCLLSGIRPPASGDHVVLFVDDETFSYNFHLSCMFSSLNSIFP